MPPSASGGIPDNRGGGCVFTLIRLYSRDLHPHLPQQAEMVDDGLQPRRAASVGCDDVAAEPLGEDHPRTAVVPAPEPPNSKRDSDAPAMYD